MSDRRRMIEEALERLGSTKQEVYETLLAKNCKGIPASCLTVYHILCEGTEVSGPGSQCPISVYLKRETGLDIDVENFIDLLDYGEDICWDLPQHIADFNECFDLGQYPKLIGRPV